MKHYFISFVSQGLRFGNVDFKGPPIKSPEHIKAIIETLEEETGLKEVVIIS
jgi:hypothetical protein